MNIKGRVNSHIVQRSILHSSVCILALSLFSLGVNMEEVWKSIPGYNGYMVSSIGRIRSLPRKESVVDRIMSVCLDTNGYPIIGLRGGGKRKTVKIHTLMKWAFFKNYDENLQIDHINNIRTDNRLENLRLCTHQQNSFNQKRKRVSSSRFKGVHWCKTYKKWVSAIRHNKRGKHLGNYDNEIEAAKAYDKKAKELFGEFAWLNFPEEQVA